MFLKYGAFIQMFVNLKQDAADSIQMQMNLRTLLRSFASNMERYLKQKPDKFISNVPKRVFSQGQTMLQQVF